MFLLLVFAISFPLQSLIYGIFNYKEHEFWNPIDFVLAEFLGGLGLVPACIAAYLMRFVEKKRWSFADYGLPLRGAFGSMFWQGCLWGFAVPLVLMAVLLAVGAVSYQGLALHGSDFATFALWWVLGMLGIGLAEEFVFRGYPLFTVSTGIGFWPAATLFSLLFGGLHYFAKPMETWIDGVSVTALGFFVCLSLRRTGSLWFAIGFHFMFDYAAMVLFASPNSGNQGRAVQGHLFDFVYRGPSWLTGGPCGIEASVFVLPLIALMFLIFIRMFPHPKYPLAGT